MNHSGKGFEDPDKPGEKGQPELCVPGSHTLYDFNDVVSSIQVY